MAASSTCAGVDLNDIHESLIEIAYKAGEIITSALPATNDTGSKKNSQSSLLV